MVVSKLCIEDRVRRRRRWCREGISGKGGRESGNGGAGAGVSFVPLLKWTLELELELPLLLENG